MDRRDDMNELHDENESDDSEWTTESDSSNGEGVIEAGEEEEARERYEREHGRLSARESTDSDIEEV